MVISDIIPNVGAIHTQSFWIPQKNHITGLNYSIQGNILISQDVLTNMEAGFLNTEGNLADKLMGRCKVRIFRGQIYGVWMKA